MSRGGWANRPWLLGLVGVGSVLLACGSHDHDCVETRTCFAPVSFVDAGDVDDWWDAGATGSDSATGNGSGGAKAEAGASSAEPGAGAAGEPEASAAGSAPQIMTVSPSDHAVGVDARAAITVTFDRPMNEASVLASYTSEDLPLSQLDVSWNAERTLLTLVPKTALAYATGSVAPGSTLDFLPKTYRFAFDDRALDGAGHALEAASFSFSTLRAVSSELAADAAHTGNWTDGAGEGVHNCLRAPPRGYVPTVCIGDDSSNVRYTGFISFDLSALPATVQSFSSARLEASGSVNGSLHALGESSLEQVPFGELGAAALTAPATASFGSFFGNTALTAGTHVELAIDVTSAVASDYAREPGAAKLSQYRLAFENIYANGIWDDLELTTSELDLAVTYFVP